MALSYRVFSLVAVFFFLTSCAALERASLWKKGRVVDLQETVVIPFSERWGMIFLEVELEGQAFNFMLDTGAPNVLDKRTAAALGKQGKFFGRVGDAYQRRQRLNFTTIKELSIGELLFKNTGALIADFRSVEVFDCMEIDGLIGSNLMRRAVWQFDFEQKEIRVAPSIEAYDLSRAQSLSFVPSSQGTPQVELQIGEAKMEEVKVDFGSGNGITALRSKIDTTAISNAGLISLGTAGVGLYGPQSDTVHYVYQDSLFISGNPIPPAILRVRPLTEGLLGLRFWRQYIVTIDWGNNRLYFEPNGSSALRKSSFGCGFEAVGDTVRLSALSVPSPASEAGLRLGDELLSYDDTYLRASDFCSFLEVMDESDSVRLRLRRGDRVFSVVIERRDLFAPVYQGRER